jgi:capsular polysaccharide biosynthesis protein
MEFREYWQVVWRRRHLIIPLVAITFVASLIFNLVVPPVYTSSTLVQLIPVVPVVPQGSPEYYPSEYYRNIYSEYISDDLSIVVKSTAFATKVADVIEQRYGRRFGVKDIADAVTKTKREHRTLKITIATGSEAMTRMIGEAMDEVLRTDGWTFFSRDQRQPVQINVLDPPRDPSTPSLVRRLMDVVLHSAVALVVGIGLAFLLHYLDDRIQDEADVERTLGWRVLGAVPTEPGTSPATSRSPVPSLGGLLPRGWRKPAATLAVLLGVGAAAAVAARAFGLGA